MANTPGTQVIDPTVDINDPNVQANKWVNPNNPTSGGGGVDLSQPGSAAALFNQNIANQNTTGNTVTYASNPDQANQQTQQTPGPINTRAPWQIARQNAMRNPWNNYGQRFPGQFSMGQYRSPYSNYSNIGGPRWGRPGYPVNRPAGKLGGGRAQPMQYNPYGPQYMEYNPYGQQRTGQRMGLGKAGSAPMQYNPYGGGYRSTQGRGKGGGYSGGYNPFIDRGERTYFAGGGEVGGGPGAREVFDALFSGNRGGASSLLSGQDFTPLSMLEPGPRPSVNVLEYIGFVDPGERRYFEFSQNGETDGETDGETNTFSTIETPPGERRVDFPHLDDVDYTQVSVYGDYDDYRRSQIPPYEPPIDPNDSLPLEFDRDYYDLTGLLPAGYEEIDGVIVRTPQYLEDTNPVEGEYIPFIERTNEDLSHGYGEDDMREIASTMKAALLGEIDNADEVIQNFIMVFGREEFERLKAMILGNRGDGLSDSIPARIDGKQEARLSSGEYVVPADAVSGLGNGDTQSGVSYLEEMVNRIRSQRGAPNPPQRINQEDVLPA